MNHQEKYNLTWQSFQTHIQTFLKDLYTSNNFTDVTLVSEDKQKLRAHRNVLSACSPVFKELLLIDEKNTQPIIFLKGVMYKELESILQFLYLGQATFNEERVNEFLETAKSLEIKDLSQIPTAQNSSPSSIQEFNIATNLETSYGMRYNTMDFLDVQTGVKTQEEELIVVDSSIAPLPKGEPIQCDYCELKYQTKTGLVCHVKAVHKIRLRDPSAETFSCVQCAFQTTSGGSLKRHVIAKHENIKFSCHLCQNEYVYSGDLKRHIMSAHEGKRYPCDFCSFQASQVGDLAKHKRNKHM